MYKGYAVYRFLDRDKNIIYIGMTNNAWRRIMNQHFKPNGHLSQDCYSQTARVDIVKLDNNLECKSLEEYLIDKYKPKFNKRDKSKNPFGTYGSIKQYDDMEKWKPYRTLKDFNSKIEKPKNSNWFVASYIAILLLIGIIYLIK
ncbi:GIY-YIG nuclease family protein [Romboutsia lituseburensis]|uniref:GIY-YIG nuclease family protein n=1 Tax=Romboutsia lituseburensis TaxID=1537 RepID=UPI00215A37D8|nr:GIY-YIG nuclease family protein [Romboutsia lituseburensis]MCR8746218.1 GIY-YIG nuclease family protein [Romboutsia lituseburensis]